MCVLDTEVLFVAVSWCGAMTSLVLDMTRWKALRRQQRVTKRAQNQRKAVLQRSSST